MHHHFLGFSRKEDKLVSVAFLSTKNSKRVNSAELSRENILEIRVLLSSRNEYAPRGGSHSWKFNPEFLAK